MTEFDPDDVAFGIVEDYLAEGPEYITIVEQVMDNGGTDADIADVALEVRNTLNQIARSFNLSY